MNSLLKITRVRPNTFLKQYFSVESDEKVCRQIEMSTTWLSERKLRLEKFH